MSGSRPRRAEAEMLVNASPSRREFSWGRHHAREALRHLGFAPISIFLEGKIGLPLAFGRRLERFPTLGLISSLLLDAPAPCSVWNCGHCARTTRRDFLLIICNSAE